MKTPRKNLTQFQIDCLVILEAKLDAFHPGFRGDERMKKALGEDARIYIDTWVLPLIEAILYGELWHGQKDSVSGVSALIRQKIVEFNKHNK
jgi:hypothetical protein